MMNVGKIMPKMDAKRGHLDGEVKGIDSRWQTRSVKALSAPNARILKQKLYLIVFLNLELNTENFLVY